MTKYKLGDGLYGTCLVDGDEELYVVAAELSDGHYCDGCELPVDVCGCEDGDSLFEVEDVDLFESKSTVCPNCDCYWHQCACDFVSPEAFGCKTSYRNNSFVARFWRWLTA